MDAALRALACRVRRTVLTLMWDEKRSSGEIAAGEEPSRLRHAPLTPR